MASETLTDIVAEMRGMGNYQQYSGDHARQLADRIEAAADRLREDEYHRGAEAREKFIYAVLGKPSNAAAMRNALEKCRALAETIWQSKGGEDVSAEIAELKDLISTALAAPHRNCDRFADELDAQLAFLNEVWLISIDRETMTEQDTYEKWTDEMRTRYGRWILAPATEQKGDNDGSK